MATIKPTKTPISVKVENGRLLINAPMQAPTLSKSGSSHVVFSTRGNMVTDVMIEGEPLIIGINAYFKG